MREENVIALKEIFANEVRMSLREIVPDNMSGEEVKKALEVDITIKTTTKHSFKNIVETIDDEILNIVNEFSEDLKLAEEVEDEYWGE